MDDGYASDGDLSSAGPPRSAPGHEATHLRIIERGSVIVHAPIRGGRIVIGRDDACDLALPGPEVSRIHCTLTRRSDGWHVEDHSKHGTRVGGRRVQGSAHLALGEPLDVGPYMLQLVGRGREASQTRALGPATHEEVASATDGTVVRAFLRVDNGPVAGAKLRLDRPIVTVGGPGSDCVVHPELPTAAVTLRVVRARVIAAAGRQPARLAGTWLRQPTPLWEGERLQIGDTVLRVTTEVLRPDDDDVALDGLVGDSPAMRRARRVIGRIARHDAPVLVLGATGTGKEAAARALHEAGPRAGGPFIALNAGSLPEALVESELFGHDVGAFTGAAERRDGAFQLADGGTLFLDEIGELGAAGQAALLRVLETGEVRRVGGREVQYPDVRVVTATHRDLLAMAAEGTFREDLLHRIAVLAVGLPRLGDRPEDVPAIAQDLLRRQHPEASLSPAALETLKQHSWPGNVRELRNVLTRAVVLHGPQIEPTTLAFHAAAFDAVRSPGVDRSAEALERRRLEDALRQAEGSKAEAARLLGIPRTSLLYRLQKHGLA